MSILTKQCKECGKDFEQLHGNKVYCSPECGQEGRRKGMREYKRNHRKVGKVGKRPCQVCGFEVVDTHHEGTLLYALCPNHHALITRGYKRIEDYNIKPVDYIVKY